MRPCPTSVRKGAIYDLAPEPAVFKVLNTPGLNELDILWNLRHPNLLTTDRVVTAKECPSVLTTPTHLGVILPKALGDLATLRPQLSRTRRAHIFDQLVAGVNALHHAGYAHCDLKLENVLLFPGDRAVLADFGSARQEPMPPQQTIETSVVFAPPALLELRMQGHDQPYPVYWLDQWQLGLCYLRLFWDGPEDLFEPYLTYLKQHGVLFDEFFEYDVYQFYSQTEETLTVRDQRALDPTSEIVNYIYTYKTIPSFRGLLKQFLAQNPANNAVLPWFGTTPILEEIEVPAVLPPTETDLAAIPQESWVLGFEFFLAGRLRFYRESRGLNLRTSWVLAANLFAPGRVPVTDLSWLRLWLRPQGHRQVGSN